MIATIKPTITNEAVNISSNIIRTIPAIRGANWRGIYSTVCFFTRHSLVRAKGEVFVLLYVCMFVCLFVRSTISRQPAGRFTQKFACRRTLVPDVSSPLLGVGGPRRAEKGAKEIFVTMGVNGGIFTFLRFLSDISATLARIHTKYYLCRDNVCRRDPSPCGAHRSLGGGGRGS